MEPMTLSFGVLIAYLNQAILQMDDPRQTSNATKYSLQDAVLAAFSVFFMQSESFLDYQRHQDSQFAGIFVSYRVAFNRPGLPED
jgi:hypothetical protein